MTACPSRNSRVRDARDRGQRLELHVGMLVGELREERQHAPGRGRRGRAWRRPASGDRVRAASRTVEISAIMCIGLGGRCHVALVLDGSSSDITGSITATAIGEPLGSIVLCSSVASVNSRRLPSSRLIRPNGMHEQLHAEVAQRRRPVGVTATSTAIALRCVDAPNGVDQFASPSRSRRTNSSLMPAAVADDGSSGRSVVAITDVARDGRPQPFGELRIVGQHRVDQLRRDAQRERDVDVARPARRAP